jgi:DNA-binding transcriptional regulator YiaG
VTAPRCGRPMERYEPRGWPPVLEDPVCGRKENHPGRCRSEMSIALARRRRGPKSQPPTGSPVIAAAIRRARKRARMSQSRLAEAMGVTVMCVQHWEGARRMPSLSALARLTRVLGPLEEVALAA